ncbi:MAG: hypothetical protein COT17_06260 [Elusimicrobia bacterium CG08_land_8_20_14_0_20_51_18]|nr:MAG: hypothetical protein COT17_06260 [Elusimicrobia bacterium CG08_land_8_20_14_0_20_51_18]
MIFTLKWLSPYWRDHKYRMITIVVLGLVSASLNAINPLFIKNIINGLEKSLGVPYIKTNVLYIVVLGLLSYVVNLFAQRNRAYMNARIEFEIRQKLFSHILTLDHSLYYNHTIGDLLTRLIDDISEKISWFACSGVFRFIQSFFTITAVISAMLYVSPLLTLWALVPVPLILFFSIKTGKKLEVEYENLQKSISEIYDFLETAFSGIRVIKANSKEKSQEDYFKSRTERQRALEVRTARLQIVFSYFFHYSVFFSIFLVYMAGGMMVINGDINIGDLIAFQMFSDMIIHPLMDISQFFISGNRAGASIKRINEILLIRPKLVLDKNPEPAPKITGISFKGVSLHVDKLSKCILENITFSAGLTGRTAVVGKIGSGKSTLLKLIIRLIEYSQGEILINGAPLRKIDPFGLREKISYVSQEASIFSQSILDNITLNREGVSDAQMRKVLAVSQLETDLARFPKGLNTEVGNRGFSISGGQKQRICIARALLKDPDFILIDDATNAMDAQTEENFWNDFNSHYPATGAIIVTHRTKTIEKSANILVLDNGKIVEAGPHSALIQGNTLYKKIYERAKLEEE